VLAEPVLAEPVPAGPVLAGPVTGSDRGVAVPSLGGLLELSAGPLALAVLGALAVAGAEAGAAGAFDDGADGPVANGFDPSVVAASAPVTAETALVTAAPPEPVLPETADVARVDGGSPMVAAWACRPTSSKRKKIPAATIATCTALRAMRRDTCSVIVSSPARETRVRRHYYLVAVDACR
jgi:hypothetical protein